MIVLGAGGHAKVLIDALRLDSIIVLGAADSNPSKKDRSILGVPVIGGDDEVMKHPPESVRLVNGVGSIRVTPWRRKLFERFKNLGYKFFVVVHPSAIISGDVGLGEGVQVMAGVVVQAGCSIGMNAIVNTHATVDHDCLIGDHSHIAPGVTISGGVRIGENTHIGTGAIVLQGVAIGRDCLVGAGAVVTCDVPDGETVAGVPAKQIR